MKKKFPDMKWRLITLLAFMFFLLACGNKEAEERAEAIKAEKLALPENVSQVSAIGRIEPEKGLVELSSESGGIVSRVYKQAGDSVRKGELILTLRAQAEQAGEQVVRNQIATQRKLAEADRSIIAQYRAQLEEKNNDLAVSERLARTGAETRQNVEIKRRERDVLLANLNTAQKNAAATVADISVLQAQLRQARTTTADRRVTADADGLIVRMDARQGEAIAPLTAFATLSPAGNMVVHGEVDEMFANRVKTGDSVEIKYPGMAEVLTRGTISYLSPILDEKSMFYGVAGEQADRRVRRFKAVLQQPQNLLINAKVECTIKL